MCNLIFLIILDLILKTNGHQRAEYAAAKVWYHLVKRKTQHNLRISERETGSEKGF